MTAEVRALVDTYAKRPLPKPTIKEWMKDHNHEIWRTCKVCGEEWDARIDGLSCPSCGIDTNKTDAANRKARMNSNTEKLS